MRSAKLSAVVCLLALVVSLLAWSVPVPAQEGGAAPSASGGSSEVASGSEGGQTEGAAGGANVEKYKSGLVEFFNKGGAFMWPLGILALVALVVILERLISLQRASTKTSRLLERIINDLKERGVEAAMETCERTRGPIAAILHAGLAKVDKGPAAVEKAIENSGAIEMAFLQRGLPILSTVANVAPLIGFLGTVSGMIHAFEAIAAAEQVSAKVVASGISEALITTMTGLVIAIPAQIAYNFFVARIDRFVIDMEESSVELLDALTESGA